LGGTNNLADIATFIREIQARPDYAQIPIEIMIESNYGNIGAYGYMMFDYYKIRGAKFLKVGDEQGFRTNEYNKASLILEFLDGLEIGMMRRVSRPITPQYHSYFDLIAMLQTQIKSTQFSTKNNRMTAMTNDADLLMALLMAMRGSYS